MNMKNSSNDRKKILYFYSDSHEEIRKVLGPPDNPDRPGFYLVTVEMRLSDDPIERHIEELKSQHNVSLAAYHARKELMEMGILDENGRLIDRGLPDDMKPGSKCDC